MWIGSVMPYSSSNCWVFGWRRPLWRRGCCATCGCPTTVPCGCCCWPGPGLWLFFPIGLMSSLSAQSRWMPFRWTIFVCFLRIAPAALGFYFVTALVLSAAVVPWYFALFGGRGILLPVAAVVSGAMLLIYARLLGRLAWLIQRLPAKERTPAKAKAEKRPPPTKLRGKKKRKPRVDVQDPWTASEDELSDKKSKRFPWAEQPPKVKPGYEVPSAEDIEGYGFAAEQPAAPRTPSEKPPPSSFAPSPEECEPYAMRDAAEPPPPPREPQSDLFDAEVRQRLAERTRVRPTLPPHPFFSGVYSFPLYSACVPNWIALSVAFLIVGGLGHMMMQVGHMLFGW